MRNAVFAYARPATLLGLALAAGLLLLVGCASSPLGTNPPPLAGVQYLPNMRQQLTPFAPLGAQFEAMNPGLAEQSDWQVGHAVSTVVSPDQKTLLVLTSGYNRIYRTDGGAPDPYGTQFNWPDSNEYVFIYDISKPTPVKQAVVQIPNAYNGIVFDPRGTTFYVSGCGDDNVHIVTQYADGSWPAIAPNSGASAAILDLGHAYDPADPNKMRRGNGLLYNAASPPPGSITAVNAQVAVKPCAAGIAISEDGQTLVVANYYNDSVSIFRGGLGHWTRAAGRRNTRFRPAPRQKWRDVRDTGRRVSVLGGSKGQRAGRQGLCVQPARPRDRRRQPG